MEDGLVRVGEVFKCLFAQQAKGHSTSYPFVLLNSGMDPKLVESQ